MALLPGRALARLSDLGWGQRLRELLRADAPASAELVRGCVPVLAEWGWSQRPAAVVAGCAVLIAVSAPTLQALRLAEAAGLTLAASARSGGFDMFCHPHRLGPNTA